jgi:hypothetical protein
MDPLTPITLITLALSLTFVGFVVCLVTQLPGSWMVRWLTFLTVSSVFLIRPLPHFFAVFAVWGATTELMIRLLRVRRHLRQSSDKRYTFSVLNLLAVMLVTAILVAVVVRHTETLAWRAILIGAVSGCWTGLALWAGVGPKRSWWMYLVGLIGTLVCSGVCAISISDWPQQAIWNTLFGTPGYSVALRIGIWCAVLFPSFLLVCLFVRLRSNAGHTKHLSTDSEKVVEAGHYRRLSQIAMGTLILFIGSFPIYVLARLSIRLPLPVENAEQVANFQAIGNSADDFTQPNILSIQNIVEAKPVDVPLLKTFVYGSEPAYARLTELMSRPSTPYIKDMDWSMQNFRSLARMVAAKAKVQSSPGDAIAICKQGIELAKKMRGGLLLHALVGIAIESMMYAEVQDVIPRLTSEDCNELIAYIKAYVESREDYRETRMRDKACMVNWYGWQSHWEIVAEEVVYGEDGRDDFAIVNAQVVWERLIMARLAIQLFQLEFGGNPENTSELKRYVDSKYLIDPHSPTGEFLRFTLNETALRVYSVGRDGVDQLGELDDLRFNKE